MEPGWISILPPLLAIILAIWSRQVYLSLFAGILAGWTILSGGNPLQGIAASLEGLVKVFDDGDNTRVILFCGLVGALITLTQRSGGVEGFIQRVTRRGWVKNRRGAQFLAGMVGVMIFVETSISCLVVGAVSRPICDRLKVSREKLAFICDSTCAPINLLIPLNAWGAFIVGLLSRENVAEPVGLLVRSIPFNFYALAALGLVFFSILSGKDWGSMKKAEQRAGLEGKVLADGARPVVDSEIIATRPHPDASPKALNMVLPVLTMVVMMPLGLLITGKGDMTAGSGSTAVLWAVLAAIAMAGILPLARGALKLDEITGLFMKGIGGMVPLMLLMVLAFALGDVARELKTGLYVAGVAEQVLNPGLVPAVLFFAACLIAFSTGTSWGTFSIMIPIALPVAQSMGLNLPLVTAAVLGGGLFGDHCSPISDTTMVASMAAACDHIDHVRTQLPYALAAAVTATLLYLLAGHL